MPDFPQVSLYSLGHPILLVRLPDFRLGFEEERPEGDLYNVLIIFV